MRILEFIKNVKIAWWATFRPDVFESFVRLYIAKKEYNQRSRAHKNCKAEKSAYNIATARFNAARRSKK